MKSTEEALRFVEHHGVVLESGAGSVPALAEAITGAPIKGSWWSHPQGKRIFTLSRAVRDSSAVLVCKAIDGKVTYVHERLWPAIVQLSGRLSAHRFDRVIEEHTAQGKHVVRTIPFPEWVPDSATMRSMAVTDAERQLEELLGEK